jgi:hypothetical protein
MNGNDERAIRMMVFFHRKYLPEELRNEIDKLILDLGDETLKQYAKYSALAQAGIPRFIPSSLHAEVIMKLIVRKVARALPGRCGATALLKRSSISGGISTLAGLLIFATSGLIGFFLLLVTMITTLHSLHTFRLYSIVKKSGA